MTALRILPDSSRPTNKLGRPAPSFNRGDKVIVYHWGPPPIIEGRACVLRPAFEIPDFYWVMFTDDNVARLRFVFPGDWQRQPDRMLACLRALYRAHLCPELTVGDLMFGEGLSSLASFDPTSDA